MKLFSLRRMEVGFWYSVVAAHVSLSLVPKVLNANDVAFLFDECFRMIDADVVELRDIQHIVGSETVQFRETGHRRVPEPPQRMIGATRI
jgi:hypothetical protein